MSICIAKFNFDILSNSSLARGVLDLACHVMEFVRNFLVDNVTELSPISLSLL